MKLTRSGLLIPSSAAIHNEKPKWRCNVPGCDALFYAQEQRERERHALNHARRDEAQIMAMNDGPKTDPVYGEGDPEKFKWMRDRFRKTQSMDPKDYH